MVDPHDHPMNMRTHHFFMAKNFYSISHAFCFSFPSKSPTVAQLAKCSLWLDAGSQREVCPESAQGGTAGAGGFPLGEGGGRSQLQVTAAGEITNLCICCLVI